MKRIFRLIFTAILILSVAIFVSGQNADPVKAVRGAVTKINSKIGKYHKEIRSVDGISTEGAEATYYHSGKILKKITATIYGETFRANGEFYFDGETPIFYFVRISRYRMPIGTTGPVKIASREERRLYFADGSLIKLMLGKKEISKTDSKFSEIADEVTAVVDGIIKASREP